MSQSANERAAVDPASAARLLRHAQDLQASGDPKAALRIIQGVAATEGQFPHCVALGSAPPGGAPAFSCCTGTLVGPNVVVTAAHCMPCRLTHVYFGTDARTPNPDRVFAIKGIVTHKDYDRTGRSENDIAVLVLEKNVPGVRPCPIATDADVSAAAFIRIVGFGLTDNDRNKAIRDVMFTADVTVADRSCQNGQVPIEGGATLPCHAGKELVTVGFGKDTCYGDSGGPAYVESGGELRLAGATSRGSKVCGFYAVYTRVDRYRDWVVGAAAVYGGVVAPPPGEAVVVTSGVRPDCTDHASEIRARLDWWSTHYPQYVPK